MKKVLLALAIIGVLVSVAHIDAKAPEYNWAKRKQKGYTGQGLEIVNKSKDTIYFRLLSDDLPVKNNKSGKLYHHIDPDTYAPGLIDTGLNISIILYKGIDADGKLVDKIAHYKFNKKDTKGKVLFFSYTHDKLLYPQSGMLMGMGKMLGEDVSSSSGINKKNNVDKKIVEKALKAGAKQDAEVVRVLGTE